MLAALSACNAKINFVVSGELGAGVAAETDGAGVAAGAVVGMIEGAAIGAAVGDVTVCIIPAIGLFAGANACIIPPSEPIDGAAEGAATGRAVGMSDGAAVGADTGRVVGMSDGVVTGAADETGNVGAGVGMAIDAVTLPIGMAGVDGAPGVVLGAAVGVALTGVGEAGCDVFVADVVCNKIGADTGCVDVDEFVAAAEVSVDAWR